MDAREVEVRAARAAEAAVIEVRNELRERILSLELEVGELRQDLREERKLRREADQTLGAMLVAA